MFIDLFIAEGTLIIGLTIVKLLVMVWRILHCNPDDYERNRRMAFRGERIPDQYIHDILSKRV